MVTDDLLIVEEEVLVKDDTVDEDEAPGDY
jgi:hypothetical protein